MQPLSPLDAISPAFKRTSELLLKPFRWGRSWKLAATGYLGAAGGVFIPIPLFLLLIPAFVPAAANDATAVLYGVTLFATIVYVVLFYFLVRLELVAFELVITRSKVIAPLWRSTGSRVWPWLGLTLVVGTACTLLMVPFGVAAFRALFTNMHAIFADPNPNPGPAAMLTMFRAMAGFYGIIAIVFLVPKLVSIFFNDFVLPFYLLEPATLGRATTLGFRLFAADFASSLGYLVCKFLLFLVGIMAQNLVTQLIMLPVLLVLGLLGVLLGVFHGASSGGGGLLFGAAVFILIVLFLASIFYVAIGCTGYVMILLDSYTAYFVGSRYPALGNLLEPPPPPRYTYTPPPPPSPNEDDGPSFPMDPALV